MDKLEKKPIKVLLRHEGKVPGEIILVNDSRYATFELWATKKSTAQGGKLICEFMKELPPKLKISLDELMDIVDNDRDKLELFCKENNLEVPSDRAWADRYATIIEKLEE